MLSITADCSKCGCNEMWASPSAKAGVLLGHSKLDTTALYVRVATKTIRSVTSPLERLALLMQGEDPGG